jgi:hypothetical protein
MKVISTERRSEMKRTERFTNGKNRMGEETESLKESEFTEYSVSHLLRATRDQHLPSVEPGPQGTTGVLGFWETAVLRRYGPDQQ